jgi:hypothetical protein
MAFCAVSTARALEDADIPADAPNDAVMATPAEIQQAQNWIAAFAGEPSTDGPFSFRYDGAFSSNLLPGWQRTVEASETASRRLWQVRWQDPKTQLRLTATLTAFKRYPAAEWLLEFENRGPQDSPLLEDIEPLDAHLGDGSLQKPVRLHQLAGDVCGERSFFPMETEVEPGKSVVMGPDGGRSSNGAFPFFNVQYGDEGVITAIGWSGQWRAASSSLSMPHDSKAVRRACPSPCNALIAILEAVQTGALKHANSRRPKPPTI